MGRIAEALKRAEQERARRLEQEAAGSPSQPVRKPPAAPACDADSPPLSALAERGAPSEPGRPEPGAADDEAPACEAEAASQRRPATADTRDVQVVDRPFVVNAPPVPPESVDRRLIAFHDPVSPIAERYRSVRTRLLTANPSGSPRLYAVTSSLPREGKTVTVANLAFSLAELRHLRVAMIDLDFHRRDLGHVFALSDRPGIAEVIRGEISLAEACIPIVRPNLHLIPAGDPRGMSPSELLTGERVAEVIREISERFHYGIVDTPPANTVADIGLVGPLCHSVLVVIRMNRTPEPVARRCVRFLQANRVPIAGSILTGCCDETAAYGEDFECSRTPGEAM